MYSKFALLALLPLLASAAPTKRASGVQISHNNDANQCLTVTDATVVDGSLVKSVPCSSTTGFSKWDISPGENPSVKLTGTNFCLDAGTNPHNNVPMKVWTCYPGLGQQNWYYTNDQRIAITGGNQCLDLGPSGPQTYQCTGGNTNQIWTLGSTPPPPVNNTTSQIHPNGDNSQCLTVSGSATTGAQVVLSGCFSGGLYDGLQLWDISQGPTKVKLHGTNYCLDAGVNPSNGVLMKIWDCLSVPQQQWYYTGPTDKHIAIEGGNQCLDKRAENVTQVQTWACSGSDVNQLWTLSS